MGGCCVLILLPILMGFGFAYALFFVGLPIYAVFALIMVVLAAVIYRSLTRRGVFARYENDATWRHTAALGAQWAFRFDIAFFALTGLLAFLAWVVLF